MKKILICILVVPLLFACTISSNVKQGKMEAVKAYVEKGGDVNKKAEPYGHTPLYIASYYGFNDIALYLIAHDADVNATAKDGTTPLMCTAIYNYPELTQILVDAGADLNIKEKNGHTALYYAKQYRYPTVAKCLEAVGALSE